jgi:hypothetical protein
MFAAVLIWSVLPLPSKLNICAINPTTFGLQGHHSLKAFPEGLKQVKALAVSKGHPDRTASSLSQLMLRQPKRVPREVFFPFAYRP